MIHLDQVSKRFSAHVVALQQVSMSVQKGEWVFLTGPSGAGKTTLMNLIFGMVKPTTGRIEVGGLDLKTARPSALQAHRRQVGFVFQNARLLPHLSVFENVALPLQIRGFSDAMIEQLVFGALEQVELSDFAEASAKILSGGEKQKVALARALVTQPSLILADEPTGNLDARSGQHIMELFRQVHRKGVTLLLATHDETWLRQYARRILRLTQGRLEKDVTRDHPV